MTLEEAIKNLKKLKSFHNGSYGTAIDMAIKALEHYELSGRQIERSYEMEYTDGYNQGWKDGREALEQQPSDSNISDPCDGCRYELNSTNGNPCYSCGKYKLTEQQPCEEDFVKHKKEVLERIAKREREIDKYIKELEALEQQPSEEDIHREREQAYMLGYEDASKKFRTEPCEDCISREEGIKGLTELINNLKGIQGDMGGAVNSARELIKTLPPITPQRAKGKWIDFNWNDGDICRWGIKCSECHTEYKHGGEMWHNPKFCPNCGAEMGGADDGREQE